MGTAKVIDQDKMEITTQVVRTVTRTALERQKKALEQRLAETTDLLAMFAKQ